MNKAYFWNSWNKNYKMFFIMLLVLFSGSIIYFAASMWAGASWVINWLVEEKVEPVSVLLKAFEHPLLNIEVKADNLVIKQLFWGSALNINVMAAYIFLGIVTLALSVVLAVVTSASRFYYVVAMGLFCVLVMGLRLEQLQVLGRIDNTAAIAVFLLVLPVSYFFQAVRPTTSFFVRFITFLSLLIGIRFLLVTFSEVSNPLMYLVNYGYPGFGILAILVVFLVASEIIAGILYLITASNNEASQNTLLHFNIASVIYLGNLLLYFLDNRNIVDLDLILISPFWILFASLIISMWTLRMKAETFKDILPFDPLGVLLYLALASICFSAIGYAFAVSNDPFIETYEDVILYTHLGIGTIFFLYILANFFGLLKTNQRVHKVMYKPQLMPLFTARLAGVIVVFAMYSTQGMYPIFQPIGGYYIGIGDLYTLEGDDYVASQYYKLASQYKYRNHRANYALASLAAKANDQTRAITYLKEAVERQPSPYAYANLANLYTSRGMYFDALFTLREATKRFPNEGRLFNNLGLQYAKTNLVDSAFYFMQAAIQDVDIEEKAKANQIAVLINEGLNFPADSLLEIYNSEESLNFKANLLALYNLQHPTGATAFPFLPLSPQKLDKSEIAYLLNYSFLNEKNLDGEKIKVYKQYQDSLTATAFEEQIGLATAQLYYKNADYYMAIGLALNLGDRSVFNRVTYYNLAGVWALEQNAPRLAASYFDRAASLGLPIANFYKAIALAEAGMPEQSAEVLVQIPDSLLSSGAAQQKNKMLYLLSKAPLDELRGNMNESVYNRIRMQYGKLSTEEVLTSVQNIMDGEYKAKALLFVLDKALIVQDSAKITSYYTALQQIKSNIKSQPLTDQLNKAAFRFALFMNNLSYLPENPEQLTLTQTEKLHLKAAQHAAAGDTSKAVQFYEQIVVHDPFNELALLDAAELFNEVGKEEDAYNFLVNATRVNQFSELLWKAYIIQSLELRLYSYAEAALSDLEEIADKESFSKFMTLYYKIKNDQRTEFQNWENL